MVKRKFKIEMFSIEFGLLSGTEQVQSMKSTCECMDKLGVCFHHPLRLKITDNLANKIKFLREYLQQKRLHIVDHKAYRMIRG